MTYEQSALLKKLAELLPKLAEYDESIRDIYAKINVLQAGRKGPIPGLADLKRRVEQIENAVRIKD